MNIKNYNTTLNKFPIFYKGKEYLAEIEKDGWFGDTWVVKIYSIISKKFFGIKYNKKNLITSKSFSLQNGIGTNIIEINYIEMVKTTLELYNNQIKKR